MNKETTTPKMNWFCNAVRTVLALALIASSLTFTADAEAASRRKQGRKSLPSISKSYRRSINPKLADRTVKKVAAVTSVAASTPAPIATPAPAVAETEAEFLQITPKEVQELSPTTGDDIVGKPRFALAEPEKVEVDECTTEPGTGPCTQEASPQVIAIAGPEQVESQPITFTAEDLAELNQDEPETTATPTPSMEMPVEDPLDDVPVCEDFQEAVDIGDACEAGDEEFAPQEEPASMDPLQPSSSPMPATEEEEAVPVGAVALGDPEEPPSFDDLFPDAGKPFKPVKPGERPAYLPGSPQELQEMLRAACRAPGDKPTGVPWRMNGVPVEFGGAWDVRSWCCQMSAYLHVVAGDSCNIPSFLMQCNTGYDVWGNPLWHIISAHGCKVKNPSGETVVGTAVMDYGVAVGYLDVCPADRQKPKGDPSKRMCVFDFNTHQVVRKYERLRFFSQPGCPRTNLVDPVTGKNMGSLVPTAPGNLARSCAEWQRRFGIKVDDPYQVFPQNPQPK